jgi:hypothetical protein
LDIAVEVAEAVTAALFGEFVPTLVNASAIRSETLMKIKPRVLLAERLGLHCIQCNSLQLICSAG